MLLPMESKEFQQTFRLVPILVLAPAIGWQKTPIYEAAESGMKYLGKRLRLIGLRENAPNDLK